MLSRFALRRLAGMAVIALCVTGLLRSEAAAGGSGGGSPPPSGPHDPGVRGGAAGAGGALPGLGTAELGLFNAALARFREVDSVSGTIADAPAGTINGIGLGPRFNLNSCAGCHAQPAVGGTSPSTNPEIAVATLDGAKNTVPPFIATHGPVREVRFISNADGTPDGGVHDLFVISGRTDAPGCAITQPNFAQAIAQSNAIFRIPTPVFGAGQIENTPDINLENDAGALSSQRQTDGISGNFNHSGNDGTITRFGWKAQNKSLLMFAGEAYNVEQGVTNELFGNERDDTASCQFNQLPEDATNLVDTGLSSSVSIGLVLRYCELRGVHAAVRRAKTCSWPVLRCCCLDRPRPESLCQCRLQCVPYRPACDGGIDLYPSEQPDLFSIQRFRTARDGSLAGSNRPGPGIGEPVPHGPVVGCRPADLLPA